MVTRMFDGDCPITGCDYHIRVEGKNASVKNIMNHVTEFHKLSDNIMDQDYNVPCPLKDACHETFTGRQWLKVSTELLSHLRNAHSNFIDPELCKPCMARRMTDMQKKLHPERYPKDTVVKTPEKDTVVKTPEKVTVKVYPKNMSDAELLEKVTQPDYYPTNLVDRNIHTLTDMEYRELMMWYNNHLPPGPEGEKLLKDRKVKTGVDYRDGKQYNKGRLSLISKSIIGSFR